LLVTSSVKPCLRLLRWWYCCL